MTDLDLSDFATVEPKQFAQLVKSAPTHELDELMAGDGAARCSTRSSTGCRACSGPTGPATTNAVIHWIITGGPDGGTDTYELVIANGTCMRLADAEPGAEARLTLGAVDFLQARLRQRQPDDAVHDRQGEGQGRPRPGRQHGATSSTSRRADRCARVLARPERGAARPARLGARLRRRRRPPGRGRVGRARGDALADHPGGREDRALRLRVPGQRATPTRPACPAASPARSCSGATPASGWPSWGPSSRSPRSTAAARPSRWSSGCRSASATPPTPRWRAFCSTEPEAGSDVAAMRTRARYDEATDEWVLNGQKAYATNGGIANVHVVTARVDPELGSRGQAAFVVPPGTPGLRRHARS